MGAGGAGSAPQAERSTMSTRSASLRRAIVRSSSAALSAAHPGRPCSRASANCRSRKLGLAGAAGVIATRRRRASASPARSAFSQRLASFFSVSSEELGVSVRLMTTFLPYRLVSAETGRKKGSNAVMPSNGWEPAPLPRTGGAPERAANSIERRAGIVNAAVNWLALIRIDREIPQPQVGEAALLPQAKQAPVDGEAQRVVAALDRDADALAEVAALDERAAREGAAVARVGAVEPERERKSVAEH